MSPAERLVGREAVLAAAGSVLRDAVAGTGQFLLISGEAGIGKTAVLAALIDRAPRTARSCGALCGRATAPRRIGRGRRSCRQPAGRSPNSGTPAGSLQTESRHPPRPWMPAQQRTRNSGVFESVARCLAGLAADRPLLVALDDLHWADEPSVRLLGFLARALTGSRVLLVGAYRDTEAPPELLDLCRRRTASDPGGPQRDGRRGDGRGDCRRAAASEQSELAIVATQRRQPILRP